MANDNSNTLTTGVLLVGGAAATPRAVGSGAPKARTRRQPRHRSLQFRLFPRPAADRGAGNRTAIADDAAGASPPTKLTARRWRTTTPPPATTGRGPVTSSQADNRPAALAWTPHAFPVEPEGRRSPERRKRRPMRTRAPRVDPTPPHADDARLARWRERHHVETTHPPTRVDKPAPQPTDAKRAPAPIGGPVTTPSHIDAQRGPVIAVASRRSTHTTPSMVR